VTLRLTTAAAVLAVTVAEVKAHLHIDDDITVEDVSLQALIKAATEDAEHEMQRALVTQRWTLTLDALPADGVIELRRPPVQSVVSLKYIDSTGVQQTLSDTAYRVLPGDLSSRVVPVYGGTWPPIRATEDAIEIVFSCGVAADAVPELIKAWIKLRVGALRGDPMPVYADALLDRGRTITL